MILIFDLCEICDIIRAPFHCSMDVIIRGELSGSIGGGGVYYFVGTLIVIPDVGVLAAPGLRPDLKNRSRGTNDGIADGVTGLKSLGVRNLNYRVAFLACSVQSVDARVS